MSPGLRERLIAVLEGMDLPRCPTCGHPSGDHLEHYPSCELAACLQELKSIPDVDYDLDD